MKKDGPTERDYLLTEKAWGERRLLTPGKERWKNTPWGASATALVESALELQATSTVIVHPLWPLADRFRQLLKEGADDPLLLTLAAKAYYAERQNWRDSRELLERVLNMPDLPTAVEAMALSTQIPQLMKQGAEYRYVRSRLVEVMIKALHDGTYDAGAEVVLVRHQIAALILVGITLPSYLTRWQDSVDSSAWPEWVKLTLRGFGEIELAWLERSSDWAVKVKDAQWEGFARHLSKAREHLVKAWQASPDRPEAAALMITVTMGECEDFDELRLWFDRSIQAQFDYQQAYNKLLWAYRPRWCGSHELMLGFGRACAATKRFDTGVPAQMFYAAMDVADENNDAFEAFGREGVREPIRAMAKGYLEQPGLPAQLQHFRRSTAALGAWLVGDYALADQALTEIGSLHYCTIEFMHQMLLHEPRFRGEVAAGSGKYGSEVQKLALMPKTTDEALRDQLLEDLAKADLSEDARAYVEETGEARSLLERLNQGEWVKIIPRKHLKSFIQTAGRWEVSEDGTLVAVGDDSTWSALAMDIPFEHDVEMRCEIAFENPQHAELSPKGYGFGTLLRWAPRVVGDAEDGIRFMAFSDPGSNRGQAFRVKPELGTPTQPFSQQEWNSFLVRIAKDKVHYELNGQIIAEQYALEDMHLTGTTGRIGFVSHRLPFDAKLKIRNIRVRKFVMADPPAAPAKSEVTKKPKPILTPSAPQSPPASSSMLRWDYLLLVLALIALVGTHFLLKSRQS
ncbi:family 16 glycoside hydrolase [Prosthecobacter debontii]|uniref:family 16 glycoside hydrolase n=1 Tax=Prosthecobacter debontii TaxID=48467 RepID=UPI0015910FF0|nr:family 16 glycoside hydrolase [Prosthecobacter debontii]